MKPTHVLIPIDFSETSLRALDYGLVVAAAFSADVTLMHVLVQPVEQSAVEEAKGKLLSHLPETWKQTVRLLAPRVTCSVEEELLRAVAEGAADLVVMGTRGLRSFQRFLFGSTTEHVLRVMPVPVITVSKTDEAPEPIPPPSPSIERILYPTDFSDPTEKALPTAIEFARTFDAELEIVHVVEHLSAPLTPSPETDRESVEERQARTRHAEESLDRIVSAGSVDEVKTRRTVLHGRPWQTILAHARETGADLIVISLHGVSFLERALLGATAERVIRDSPIPVLGIPAS